MAELDGRVALVTGAGSGIGRAIAVRLAEAGAAVSVVDLDGGAARDVAADIVSRPWDPASGGSRDARARPRRAAGRALALEADVSEAGACRRAVEQTLEHFGRLDILVNNAGIIRRATIVDTSEEDWQRVMAVNVTSVFLLSRLALPPMIAAGGGVILNIASGWGLVGGPRAAAYCASKGAVVQLTRAMAIDHGPDRVRVACICPGDTDTPMLEREAQETGIPRDEFLRAAAARPIGRIGQPHDIAEAALYLVSDAASFVTGTVLIVDGGGLAG